MVDRFFLGVFFLMLLLIGGFTLYERTEISRLESQIAELRYEVSKVEKAQRVVSQDSDFVVRLLSGASFKEIEDE